MHRVAFSRISVVARSAALRPLPMLRARQPALWQAIRFETNQSGLTPEEEDAKQAGLALKQELQKDWDARVITYEELKPRTQQPQPVSTLAFDV